MIWFDPFQQVAVSVLKSAIIFTVLPALAGVRFSVFSGDGRERVGT